jgi:aconitate hydratase 2/2-methylisocitrate dehydratase
MHHELPEFISNRGGIPLRPGDGIIHSWLNRMLLPDTVGTGGDSHTRFPIGISFPAGLWPGGLWCGHRRHAAGHA